MVKALVVEKFGGPEVLQIKEVSLNKPGPQEVLVRHTAIGVNFLDIYHRTGEFDIKLPFIPGSEACGVVEEVGSDVQEFKKGDRVAYGTSRTGAYSEARVIDHNLLIPVPDYIKDKEVVAVLLKGMTAFYLLRRTFFISNKHVALVHAAAGGVGQILCRLAKHYKGKVIATTSTKAKVEIVKSLGVDKVINYDEEDFVESVMAYTKQRGVHVVYDSVGHKTFDKSLSCLRDFGLMVSYGRSSGEVERFSIEKLADKSLFITRPSLFNYTQYREELLLNSNEVLTLTQQGVIKTDIFKEYKLSEVAEAHKNIANRSTTGQSIILL